MTSNRTNLYQSVLVDTNKEKDLLESSVPDMELEIIDMFTVPQWCEGRIDMISYIHYRTTSLWWLIALANDIMNPIEDIKTGDVLKIPSIQDYYRFYNRYAYKDRIKGIFSKRKIKVEE